LAELLEQEHIWSQLEPERKPVPDESRAELTVELGSASATTWEWYNDLEANDRVVKVSRLLASWAPAGAP
jgi:hypothetical protein